ncbi:carboxypeptidase [Vibrio sp. SCSIO 43132]|uniref:M14 family zinc carboxypeptidase n=1 Tax=Vibrio sp. SCSIO 43132 TaxID=2779363 RepID=UPI001CAA0555|nr:M14 family zinc carboxypeptidase [Vibrio sp. SCSIO 43132]UAB72779.1 carboxypeptidase [Vibrio sp. SCSIO 43132]
MKTEKTKKVLLSVTALLPTMIAANLALAASPDTQKIESLIRQEMNDTSSIYTVKAPNPDLYRKALISLKSKVLESDETKMTFIMSVSDEEKNDLTRLGFKFSDAQNWINKRNEKLEKRIDNIQRRARSNSAPLNTGQIQGIPGYSCYETVEESYSVARGFTTTYPNLAEWKDVGDSFEKTQRNGGYDIFVLKLTNKAKAGNKPALYINSAIHAREYTTAALTLDFARYLLEGYGNDADATWILDHHEIHLMIQSNPDGRKMAESGLSWRKNTNTNYCGPTSNQRGADLNRNFTFSWNSTTNGSSGNQCDNTYRGTSPASEPETKVIEAYARNLWSDRRGPNINDAAPLDTSGIHLDIHSYSELMLWPWGGTQQAAPNGPQLQTLGRKLAYFNNYYPTQSIGLYPTDGTSDGVSYGELGVAAFTFELGKQFFESCSSYENKIKPDNLKALIYAAKVVRTPYVTPSGPDTTQVNISNGASGSGVNAGTQLTITATASDTRYNNRNGTEPSQNIAAAEYYIDVPPWDTANNPTPIALNAVDGFNQKTEQVTGVIDTTGLSEGKHMVYVRAKDSQGNWGPITAEFVNIRSGGTNPPATGYCDTKSGNARYEWIQQVDVGNFSHQSNAAVYSDHTESKINKSIAVTSGQNSLTLTPGYSGSTYREHWKVWIDLNQDGDFEDAGESVFATSSAAAGSVNGTFNVPESAKKGKTTMRVVMSYNSINSACGTFRYGEAEDYTVDIQ